MSLNYVKDGAAIYRESFATIRREADLSRFSADLSRAVVRMIHACGMTDLPQLVAASENAAENGRRALLQGAPILCDSEMLAKGIIRSRLPHNNEVVCTLNDARTLSLAAQLQTTRSAAAVELWREKLNGAVIVIGNAPTALFHLLEMVEAGAPKPSLVVGVPVGFVGAAESKEALAQNRIGIPYITVHGRRGGSAIGAAAVNALTSEKE
jgi:precorrin-8X/cobalt-precorrin-8 methylmutase